VRRFFSRVLYSRGSSEQRSRREYFSSFLVLCDLHKLFSPSSTFLFSLTFDHLDPCVPSVHRFKMCRKNQENKVARVFPTFRFSINKPCFFFLLGPTLAAVTSLIQRRHQHADSRHTSRSNRSGEDRGGRQCYSQASGRRATRSSRRATRSSSRRGSCYRGRKRR
jgi:hypothetical protein